MMNEPKSLKKGLLAQEGLESARLSDQQRKEIENMLTREQNRVRSMRWVTASLWMLFVVGYIFWGIAGIVWDRVESPWLTALFGVWILLFPLAIVSTISLYVRWRALDTKEIKLRLQEIEERLNRMGGQP